MTGPFRFGTVGSPTSTPPKPGGSVGGIQQMAALGLGALELAWVQSVRVSEATCQVIQETGRKSDVALSVHAPYFINLNADGEEWPKSRQRLMDAAWYGWLAGATDIVFHPGSYFGKPPAEVLPGTIERLAWLCRGTRSKRCIRHLETRNHGEIRHARIAGRYPGNEPAFPKRAPLPGFRPPACPTGRWLG